MRDALLLHDTLSITGILITDNLTLTSRFLATVSLRALLFSLGVGLGTFAILCFRRAKKRRWGFRKRRLGVYVFSVRYSIRFVYQAWLSWIALLSHCKVTAGVVGCRGGCFDNGSMATMTLL